MRGTVERWDDDEGWGVVVTGDGTEVWTHYSAVEMPGYRRLQPGGAVELDVERFPQDGFAFRATRVHPI